MTVMLERWNDDRMDDLAGKVDEIGVQLREQRREMRTQGSELRQEMRELRGEIKASSEQADGRLERLERTMTQAAVALSSSIIVGFAAMLATQL